MENKNLKKLLKKVYMRMCICVYEEGIYLY